MTREILWRRYRFCSFYHLSKQNYQCIYIYIYIYTHTHDKTGNILQRNTESLSRNHCCRGKTVLHILSMFVALVIEHTKRMRRVISAWPLWLHHTFRHYLINDTIFGKKVIEHKMCFDFLYNFYLKYLSFWEELSEIIWLTWKRLHVKCPFFVPDFSVTWIFQTYFAVKLKYQFFSKSFQWKPSCSMRTDGRTWRTS